MHFERVFEDQVNVYILLELCQNYTLNELIQRRHRLTELEVQCYLIQIIRALQYLHANNIIHRDLKLGNLFLNDKMELKLGDFGLATKLDFSKQKRYTVCGTPNYIAPEVLNGKCGHSFEVDIWSLGVIIYTLIFGKVAATQNFIPATPTRITTTATQTDTYLRYFSPPEPFQKFRRVPLIAKSHKPDPPTSFRLIALALT